MSSDEQRIAKFFRTGGKPPLEIRVDAQGKPVAGTPSSSADILRFELRSKNELLFWTSCCGSQSQFDFSGRTLTITYVVRNAILSGLRRLGSGVDVDPLVFQLVASVDANGGLRIDTLYVGRFISKGKYEWFPGSDGRANIWAAPLINGFRRANPALPVALLRDLSGKEQPKIPTTSDALPFAIRRVSGSGRRSRVEVVRGINHPADVPSSWSPIGSSMRDGLDEPRFRAKQNVGHLEFLIDLAYPKGHTKVEYSIVQTDPWEMPGDDEDAVWREFRIDGLDPRRLLYGYERTIAAPVRDAVAISNEPDNITLLPDIEVAEGEHAATATIVWEQRDNRPDEPFLNGSNDFGVGRNVRLSTTGTFPVRATLPGLYVDDGPIAFVGQCRFEGIEAADRSHGFQPNTVIDLSGLTAAAGAGVASDIGALKFGFAKASARKLRIVAGLGMDAGRPMQRPSLHVEAEFIGIAVHPVGFDPAPTSRFSDDVNSDSLLPPIVALVGEAGFAESALVAREWLRDDHARSLAMTLVVQPPHEGSDNNEGPPFELIVLDQNPFFLGKIAFRLPNGNNPDGNEYASWSLSDPDGPRWRFRSMQPDATLTLPTQGIGEAYERRKDIDDPLRKRIDYRLGPHAVFELRLRDDERAYSDLPWNLRLLFGRPGEPVAGPMLSSARFELLYGLESTLRPAGVRLTTDEIQRGRIPQGTFAFKRGCPCDEPESAACKACQARNARLSDYQQAWERLVVGYQSRLLSLQAYRPLVDGPLHFDQNTGLQQRLRIATREQDDRREFADLHSSPYLEAGTTSDPGLRGGATFGFESRRIYEAVTRSLQSTSGELSGVAWTALGGHGALKARFDEDRSIIEATVEQGRVSHYAVERIGRIGVFWNRAKHVIVYERTTQRAKRYASGEERQNALEYLPIVRKVDEYVEILEPERRFAPAGQPSRATGFVQGLKFADRIIRVSSLWGVDVGEAGSEVGWAVPLWRHGEKADFFPKPLVNLIAASEDAAEEALHAISDPEHLIFFTNTVRDAGGDTDRWAAVEGVDFVDAAVQAESAAAAFGDRSAAALREPKTAPVDLPSALAACTWRIEGSEIAVDLIAGRGSQPISAKLRNFTVMRKPAESMPVASPVRRARKALSTFDELRRDVSDTLAKGLSAGWRSKQWEAEGDLLRVRVLKLRQDLENIANDASNALALSPCALLIKQAQRPLLALSRDLRGRIGDERDKIKLQARSLGNLAENDIDQLAQAFSRQIDSLAVLGGQARAHLDGTLDRAARELRQFEAQVLSAVSDAVAELEAVLDGIGVGLDLPAYGLRIARARQSLADLRKRLMPLLDELHRICVRLAARWNGKKPGADLATQLPARVSALRRYLFGRLDEADAVLDLAGQAVGDFGTALDNAIEDIKGRIEAARQTFSTEMRALTGQALDGIETAKARVSALSSDYLLAIEKMRAAVQAVEKALKGATGLETFMAAVDAESATFSALVEKVCAKANSDIAAAIKTGLCDYLPTAGAARIEALQDGVTALLAAIDALAAANLQAAQSALEALWPGLSQTLEGASDWLGHAVDSLGESVRTAFNAPLSLLRAFGAAPNLPELSFNREWLEYVFDPSDLTIDISPVTSFFAGLGDDLKGLSLNLPSIGLDASGLLPPALRDFDLNAVFGSLGGMKMPGLLSRVKLPNLDRNAVKVTHGFDKKTRRAWVQADVDVPYDTNPVLFDAMSLALRLVKPKFSARSRMEAGLEGKPGFYAKGEIASTIRLEFSGNALVDLRDAAIRFDDRGQFDFDFSPDRIDFKAGLKFLADLIRARNAAGQDPEQAQGFVPALIEADGLPIGVRTTLELDPGPLNFGAFSIDGLALNLSFELVAKPEFKVGTRLSLASPDKPFVISVGLLGGGGWLAAAASYLPSKGLVESEVDIAIAAGRVFSVNFGPIRGMAQVVFGINAKFVSRGSRSRLSLIVFFLFSGEFRLWGIITVGIYLRLEIEYQSTGSLVGRGVVHITVKIGRFFKRTVRQRVNYRFAGKDGGQRSLAARSPAPARLHAGQPAADLHRERAAAYLARYED